MSLMTCSDCKRDVSTDATACPGCGRPMTPAPVQAVAVLGSAYSHGNFGRLLLVGAAVVFVFGACVMAMAR
jgi:predicted amidophosphoribosyltransferase